MNATSPSATACIDGVATPITYDTAGTPAEILAEDKIIEKFPLPVKADKVKVVPVDELFEKAPAAEKAAAAEKTATAK